jgi:hypothetical protein
MKELDIERELLDLAAKEEVLAFFDFVLPITVGAAGSRDVEGLCKISRPRARNSRATYFSLFFVVDSQDAAVQQALDTHMREVDWNALGTRSGGVDCVLPVPHRGATAGLFLKEVDVYLDGSRPADATFVRDAILPAVAQTMGLRAGELTVWEEKPSPGSASADPTSAAKSQSILDRLRRLAGLGAS